MTSKPLRVPFASGIIVSASLLAAAAGVSCSSNDKSASATAKAPQPAAAAPPAMAAEKSVETDGGTRTVTRYPGEAGGVIEETATATATVRGIDRATRKITLQNDEDATTGSFTAPPEMRNIDQLSVGDRVKVTVVSRMNVFVDQAGPADPAHAAVLVRAPKGTKPGALVAEAYETAGTIKSIDPATRKATIQFPGGQPHTVTARPDVDLSRYKAGDNVVIQVTQQLTVITEAP